MNYLRVWLPFLILLFLLVVFYFGLGKDPSEIPSVKINKQAPNFSLSTLKQELKEADNYAPISPQNLKGKVWVLNVFASWCLACNIEHPIFMKIMTQHPEINLIGLAYKDFPGDTEQWLKKNGNPYSMVLVDSNGSVGIDYGVYGVPETFIIDSSGIVRFKNVGPIKPDFYENQLMSILKYNK